MEAIDKLFQKMTFMCKISWLAYICLHKLSI